MSPPSGLGERPWRGRHRPEDDQQVPLDPLTEPEVPRPVHNLMLPGPESPFEIDATIALRSGEGQDNRLAVHVPNATNDRIDGMVSVEKARSSD
jgi:hypothetical protein